MDIRTVNGLCVTQSICYPRSGHQALVDVLQDYFGDRMVYCEPYLNPECEMRIHPSTNYQKNHDFNLETEIRWDEKYIVQVRDPLDAMNSRWEMETRSGKCDDTEDNWRRVMAEWGFYWSRFMEKWVFQFVPNRLVIRYDDLLANPMDVVANAIQFVQGMPNVIVPKIRMSLDRYPVKARRRKPTLYCHIG